MADIKVLYVDTDGLQREHSEAADSIKLLSLKTATAELTDAKLSALISGGDGTGQHHHDSIYYRENEFINTSAGSGDAGKPIVLNAAGKLANSLIDVSSLNALLSHGTLLGLTADNHVMYTRADGTRAFTGVVAYNANQTFTDEKSLVSKKYVDDLFAGQEWKNSANARQITPPGSPTTDFRYLIDGTLGTATGAWVAKENQIAQWSGSAWIFEVPTIGTYISVDSELTVIYLFDGTSWNPKSFEVTTASAGLVKVGNDIRIDSSAAGNGLALASGVLAVNVDASSIEINADILRVKALGIKDTMIDFGTGALQVSAVDIPIADAGNTIVATNVETALQEIFALVTQAGVSYTVGSGGVTKGDALVLSANNTVTRYSTITTTGRVVGLAASTVAATGTVVSVASDVLLTGVLTAATAGTPYYWTGSELTTTIPSSSGSNVWEVGVAANATALHTDIRFVKKNA